MCTYFNTKIDVAQNLVNDFFLTLTVREPFIARITERGTGLISEKTEVLYSELTKRKEACYQ